MSTNHILISQEHLIYVKFPGRRLGMRFIEVNQWSFFLSEEKDLIHEICCLWFPDIYIAQDRYFAVTHRFTDTDFLPCAYGCARVTHVFTLLLCHHRCLQLPCADLLQVGNHLPDNKASKKRYSLLHWFCT